MKDPVDDAAAYVYLQLLSATSRINEALDAATPPPASPAHLTALWRSARVSLNAYEAAVANMRAATPAIRHVPT